MKRWRSRMTKYERCEGRSVQIACCFYFIFEVFTFHMYDVIISCSIFPLNLGNRLKRSPLFSRVVQRSGAMSLIAIQEFKRSRRFLYLVREELSFLKDSRYVIQIHQSLDPWRPRALHFFSCLTSFHSQRHTVGCSLVPLPSPVTSASGGLAT